MIRCNEDRQIPALLRFSAALHNIQKALTDLVQPLHDILLPLRKFRSLGVHFIAVVMAKRVNIVDIDRHKIRERFYKRDSSRGNDKKGTGLGLSIVKEIINAHDENITVASTVDVGTEFIFTLPMSEGN